MKVYVFFRILFLFLAIIIYAFFSSPTPNRIGLAELIIGYFLIIAFIPDTLRYIGGSLAKNSYILSFKIISFIFLLIVPSIYGLVINHNSIYDYIRDIIPFIYLYIPVMLELFTISHQEKEKLAKLVLILILIVGISFSIKYFITAHINFSEVGSKYFSDNLMYYPMEPSVLFTATFFLNLFIVKIITNKLNISNIFKSILIFFGGLIPFIALSGMLVRAQIILIVISVFITIVILSLNKKYLPKVVLFIIPFLLLTVFVFKNQIINLINSLIFKFKETGLNGRNVEFEAAISVIISSFLNFFFGIGWGGSFSNPVCNFQKVRFVHNLFLYLWLKTGFIGFILFSLYFIPLIKTYILDFLTVIKCRNYQKLPLFLAIFNVLIVYTILEAGYKTLSFGLILSLIILHRNIITKFLL